MATPAPELTIPRCTNSHQAVTYLQTDSTLVREETLGGVDYLAAPAVLLVESVLHGNLFVSEAELHEFPEAWNGRYVTIGHPQQNGQDTSVASHPELLEAERVGLVFSANAEGPKLKAEIWLNIAVAEEHSEGSQAALQAFREGTMIELSTAYFAHNIEQPGTFQGNSYEFVQTNLKPDHLALIPGGTGACSIADGCGVPRVNAAGGELMSNALTTHLLELARSGDDLIFDGTESDEWSAPTLSEFVDGWFEHTEASRDDFEGELGTVAALPEEARQWIAQHTLLGDAGAESFAQLSFFPVVDPSSNDLNENALDAVNSGRGAQADISDQQLQSARGTARTLLEEEFGRELEDDAEMNSLEQHVRTLAEFVGLSVRDEETNDIDDDQTPADEAEDDTNAADDTTTNEGGNDMADERDEQVEALAANEDAPFDAEALADMTDEQVAALDAQFNADPEPADPDPGDGEGTDTDPAPEGNTAEALDVDAETLQATATLVDTLGGSEGIQDFTTQAETIVSQANERREKMVAAICANSDFEADDLEGDSLDKLQKLYRQTAPGDYGLAAVNGLTDNDDDDYTPPKALATASEREEQGEAS